VSVSPHLLLRWKSKVFVRKKSLPSLRPSSAFSIHLTSTIYRPLYILTITLLPVHMESQTRSPFPHSSVPLSSLSASAPPRHTRHVYPHTLLPSIVSFTTWTCISHAVFRIPPACRHDGVQLDLYLLIR
jgi:hypothetical protein